MQSRLTNVNKLKINFFLVVKSAVRVYKLYSDPMARMDSSDLIREFLAVQI